MATTSLDNQLQQYWPLLEKEEQQSILTFIKSFLKNKGPKNINIEQYNKELEEAEKRMNAGQYTSLEDALKQSESW